MRRRKLILKDNRLVKMSVKKLEMKVCFQRLINPLAIFNNINLIIFLLLVCFNTNFLLTQRDICTAKYRTEVFLCIQLLTEAIFVAFASR